MDLQTIINEIKYICSTNTNNMTIYMEIKKVLNNVNKNIVDHTKDYISIEKIENSYNKSCYYKYKIYSSELFDIFIIDWKKTSCSRIHDHPKKGCIMKILDGYLIEEIYDNNLSLISFDTLKTNNIAYKIGKTVLHKIICREDTISFHVYIPGQYVTNYY